ncbi:hypothetical protein JAAARDRAFT_191392 [Jaapia argillacea MUCL 33604]|uniref:Uncharacterized protein n=1 Tax=Jaapia argillacea MUCL 33604 TaxID=933084 RepID=A0A067Q576_9AGAM|nr:hypothetical protein JAAARDRAFT_191392 [Jaapia argillacea MUCL 33604]
MVKFPYHSPLSSPLSPPSVLLHGIENAIGTVYALVAYHVYTVILFTWTDYKTIFFPVTAFACATAPVSSLSTFVQGELWIWIHLLLCNVSNQARSESEDAVNRPWRPLPSKRISQRQAVALRWITVAFCIIWSASYNVGLVYITLALFVTTFLYDECGLASHPIGKNLCNIGGYTTFELGATTILGHTGAHVDHLDSVACRAISLSGILIFTTIQAQDFSDVEGDSALGRVTFPIYAPELSRAVTLFAMIAWSLFLPHFWGIGNVSAIIFAAFGSAVGCRFYWWRAQGADKRSYLIYNVWLMFAHILPLHARIDALSF